MAKKLINLAKIDFAGGSGSAPVPPGPGPTPTPSADADVVLRDYDGSVVASYTKEEFAALTELPTPPEHEGLTFQGWNWSLADAQSYCAQYGMVDIGATYITSDGKTRINIILTEGRTTPTLGLGINGSVDVDWGDGSAHDTVTGSSLNNAVYKPHVYSGPGEYVITVTPLDNTSISIVGTSTIYSQLLSDRRTATNSQNIAYQNSVKFVMIGRGVTSIGGFAFRNCTSLSSVTIPESVTSIGNDAFYNCSSLISVTIPQGVTSIGNNVFRQCYNLTSISIPQGVTSIGNNVFRLCYNLTSISIPESVTSIGDDAFNSCTSLSSVSIPESVTSIGNEAFNNCTSLRSITIPQNVTSIGNYAFNGCTSLRSITIPQNVTSIGNYAFNSCYSLTSVTIPQSVTSIGSNAFNSCTILRSITIPQGVTSIGTATFRGCSSLSSVTIPQGVTSIGSSAFYNCSSLAILRSLATTPPTIAGDTLSGIPRDCIIYVPDESVAAYKAATYWSVQASKIQPMP